MLTHLPSRPFQDGWMYTPQTLSTNAAERMKPWLDNHGLDL